MITAAGVKIMTNNDVLSSQLREHVIFRVDPGEKERLEKKLRNFPEYFFRVFLSSCRILVLCELENSRTVAGCGVTRVSSYLLIYVETAYRGLGIGERILKFTISEARKQGLDFVALAVSSSNTPAVHLYYRCKFREIRVFKKFGFILMMLPLSQKGELIYAFLRKLCSSIPETAMLQTIEFLMSVTGRIRTWVQ